jgi:hypothetical protein
MFNSLSPHTVRSDFPVAIATREVNPSGNSQWLDEPVIETNWLSKSCDKAARDRQCVVWKTTLSFGAGERLNFGKRARAAGLCGRGRGRVPLIDKRRTALYL